MVKPRSCTPRQQGYSHIPGGAGLPHTVHPNRTGTGLRATNCNCAHGNLHLDPLRQNNDSLANATVHITPNQVHHRLRISY